MSFQGGSLPQFDDPQFTTFPSRRSVVHSTKAIVSSTSSLASQAGLLILREGGNAADAAVATAAVLNLVDPAMTGIGGDMFCLFYNAETKKVHALNGSGRSPFGATLEAICKDLNITNPLTGKIPNSSVHAITVPGAAAGWVDTVDRFGSGKVTLRQVLDPAIKLAEEGFPVSEISAYNWGLTEAALKKASENGFELLKRDPKIPDGYRAPRAGEIFKSPSLAKTFRLLAEHGKAGFYEGSVADAIITATQNRGGYHSLEDLKYHAEQGSESVDPISIHLNGQDNARNLGDERQGAATNGVELWEHPPNGQGIVALMTLGILKELEEAGKIPKFAVQDHNSAKYLHALIESLRISFADTAWFVADPHFSKLDQKALISKEYLADRAKLFDPNRASGSIDHGSPAFNRSDTVYFAVTDLAGNGCSFINSVSDRFGTCIVPAGTGFALQSRGSGFWLDSNHPNVFEPGKRPYHTIIPAMVTNSSDGTLHTVYGVMGGAMQPQGHVQVLLNMLRFNFNSQVALDAPRVCINVSMPGKGLETGKALEYDRTVYLEEGIREDVARELERMGHRVKFVEGFERSIFGRGQVIRVHHDPVDGQRIYSAGSDGRGDGAALPY